MSNVFAQAAERLSEFTAGSDYAAFLNAKAAEAAAQGDFARRYSLSAPGGSLLCRCADKVLPGCTAAASPEIHLGGLIAVSADGRTRLDLSLDARTGRTEAVVLQQFQTGHHTVKLYGGEIV